MRYREYNKFKRENCVLSSKIGTVEIFKLCEIRDRVKGFRVCFDGFLFCFFLVFL